MRSSDKQSLTNSDRLFHARGPATAKAGSPSDERRVAGSGSGTTATFNSSGKLFHDEGPAAEQLRGPKPTVLVLGRD